MPPLAVGMYLPDGGPEGASKPCPPCGGPTGDDDGRPVRPLQDGGPPCLFCPLTSHPPSFRQTCSYDPGRRTSASMSNPPCPLGVTWVMRHRVPRCRISSR